MAALNQELGQYRNQAVNTDDRVEEMMGLLANSEREIVKMHKELSEAREQLTSSNVQLEALKKENASLKRKNTKLEKAKEDAKGQTMEELRKQLDAQAKAMKDLQDANQKLQQEMADKTPYMQAIEGQKGKLRAVKPPADQGGP